MKSALQWHAGLGANQGQQGLEWQVSINHGHKCGDAIREEGSGPSMNGGEQGLVLVVSKK